MEIDKYFKKIEKDVSGCYKIANRARELGIDPVSSVETPVATTLAEKTIGLISVVYPQVADKRITNRILELEKKYGKLDPTVAFVIAEEIAKEKYCKFKDLIEAIDAGIRVGFAYITLGVVSSPIEGYTELKLGKTRDGKDYFKVYFSGPIRSAGTTASCVILMLIDYLREIFGFAKYDPDENEVKRYVTENYDYHERVTNLQYLPTESEISDLAKNIPIQICGDPTEKREVSNYKDLKRVETNFIRGGMCLIFSEGLAQKAQKGLRLLKVVKSNGLKSTGFDFLDDFLEKHKKGSKDNGNGKPTYIKDLVAGRPILSHPGRSGGLRFRYGRARTGGFSATLVHPATMAISNSFLSSGTQLKIEKPTKGCALSVCDTIDGPIVKMKGGTVKKVKTFEVGKELYKDIEEIIYLGDILFPVGDVINRNYNLIKAGYVEEWWKLNLEKSSGRKIDDLGLDCFNISFDEAVNLSEVYKIPLHPKFIYYWNEVSNVEFLGLMDWISRGIFNSNKLILPYNSEDVERFSKGKRCLELLGVEHSVSIENVIIANEEAKGFLFNLGILNVEGKLESIIDEINIKIKEFGLLLDIEKKVLEFINLISSVEIKDKSGEFIGSRMGRPEKAKLRKLIGSPHALFPVAEEGGRLRSFQSALEKGFIRSDFPNYYCKKCDVEGIFRKCSGCGEFSDIIDIDGRGFSRKKIEIRELFAKSKSEAKVNLDEIPIVKGIKGTSNEDHSCEYLTKGLLRAKHKLNVNKDGTIRYDMTEMALTHFKPIEIGIDVRKLKELGYDFDYLGEKLENENQILELKPHDVILPSCPETLDEKAEDVFLRIAKFIDDELEKIYGLDKFYNVKNKGDLIGQLVVCIAPHICTATVGRLIGFSKIQALLASPFMHAAMRRDCDGDECAAMFLMDLLLNFSRKFLPAHRGGTQDSPLVLNTQINAGDVDDQILDFVTEEYPLELYELAEKGKHSSELKIGSIKQRLADDEDPFTNIKFTHHTEDFNAGVINSAYKILPTMTEKVEGMMDFCEKTRAVDTTDVARLIIERHFIRDTRGNLRKFSMQGFRCVSCNSKYRRPPLIGKCGKCGGKIIFTISQGSIVKYMQPALNLADKYNVSNYLIESLELTQMYIDSIFGREKEKQEKLKEWFS